jgi:hypothetical protein
LFLVNNSKWSVVAVSAVGILALIVSISTCGCVEKTDAQREEEYRVEWKEMMSSFFKRLDEDDQKAADLSEEGDIGGVINLVTERIKHIDSSLADFMRLNPPPDYVRLQVITEYFMLSLIDQLEAQNEFNKASVSGEPTADLETKVQSTQARVGAVGQQLTVSQLEAGIILEEAPVEDQVNPGLPEEVAPVE